MYQVSREEEVEIQEDAPEGPAWKIEESVWATRPKETDSRDFWDNEKVGRASVWPGCQVWV